MASIRPSDINTNLPYHPAPEPGADTPQSAAQPGSSATLERQKDPGTMRGRLSNLARTPTIKQLFKPGSSSAPPAQHPTVEQRKQQVRAERAKREAGQRETPSSTAIRAALKHVRDNKDASLLLFSYSPTGGGHTGRTLNILEKSLESGDFKKGDVVMPLVPSEWNNRPQAPQLTALAAQFEQAGVKPLLAGAEKSVHGFLRAGGKSDDGKILTRIALMPKRPKSDITSITQARVYGSAADFTAVPTINANDLMDSIQELLGAENMHKVKVLTDMEPALQKAAGRFGVPGSNRVDQQNHPILLNTEEGKMAANLQAHMSVLAKVLGGHGERIAYIGLGEKNTLQKMTETADRLGLTPATTKQQALHAVSEHLLQNARPLNVATLTPGPEAFGILRHPSIVHAGDVKNLAYVYANDNQADVAKFIGARIAESHADYQDTLFVFCGKDTFKPGVKGANALHMAYLADADGITTAGAGTIGEFCYLHKAGEAKSKLMTIPIEGHNEQDANAEFLRSDASVNESVIVANHLDQMPLNDFIQTFMTESREKAAEKYDGSTLSGMLTAVGNPDTYPAHGRDLLAGTAAMTAEESNIYNIEGAMRDEPVFSANRHFQKLVLQSIEELIPAFEAAVAAAAAPASKTEKLARRFSSASSGPSGTAMEVQLRQHGPAKDFTGAKDLSKFMLKLDPLMDFLADGEHVTPPSIMLLNESQTLFRAIAAGTYKGARAIEEMEKLREKFGHAVTTGF